MHVICAHNLCISVEIRVDGSCGFWPLFLYRAVGAFFSSRLRNEIRSRPCDHFLMFCALPVAVGLIVLIHPAWLKRYEERGKAFTRVEQAGGWEVLKRDCLIIASRATNYDHGDLVWLKNMTNFPPLPPGVAALDPYQIRCTREGSASIVRVHVLGHHSTDFAWPEYWLWFYCGDQPNNNEPKVDIRSAWFSVTKRKVASGVFEVTY